MKKYCLLCLIFVCLVCSACSKPTEQQTEKKSEKSSTNTTQSENESSKNLKSSETNMNTQKEFTVQELSKYNGKNGNPAYVAVDGKVYDVTNADEWNNGMHKDGIKAGKDLSSEISKSPHGKSVLSKLPVVGVLKK